MPFHVLVNGRQRRNRSRGERVVVKADDRNLPGNFDGTPFQQLQQVKRAEIVMSQYRIDSAWQKRFVNSPAPGLFAGGRLRRIVDANQRKILVFVTSGLPHRAAKAVDSRLDE